MSIYPNGLGYGLSCRGYTYCYGDGYYHSLDSGVGNGIGDGYLNGYDIGKGDLYTRGNGYNQYPIHQLSKRIE